MTMKAMARTATRGANIRQYVGHVMAAKLLILTLLALLGSGCCSMYTSRIGSGRVGYRIDKSAVMVSESGDLLVRLNMEKEYDLKPNEWVALPGNRFLYCPAPLVEKQLEQIAKWRADPRNTGWHKLPDGVDARLPCQATALSSLSRQSIENHPHQEFLWKLYPKSVYQATRTPAEPPRELSQKHWQSFPLAEPFPYKAGGRDLILMLDIYPRPDHHSGHSPHRHTDGVAFAAKIVLVPISLAIDLVALPLEVVWVYAMSPPIPH